MEYPVLEYTRLKLNELFEDKTVFYFPIVSMQNRETFEYKLDQDGNVNRFITFFSKCNSMKRLYIALPTKHESIKYYLDFANSQSNIKTIFDPHFGRHALEQRTGMMLENELLKDCARLVQNSDVIIVESQTMAKLLMARYIGKIIIYWCPVSVTSSKSRSFIEAYRDIDKGIFKEVDYIMVASPEQYDYLIEDLNVDPIKVFYYYELMDRSLSVFSNYEKQDIIETSNKVIYLPFRLTDEGYKTDYILDVIEELNQKYPNKFKVAYSDPNNSKFERIVNNPELYVKVSSDRNTYYSYLDSENVIIPYFEDINYVNHAAIHEFNDSKTKCTVLLNNTEYHAYNLQRKSIHYIDIQDLYKNLEKMINE